MIVFDFLITYLMDSETALTFTHGHFNQVVFAVSIFNQYPIILHMKE